MKGSSFIGEKIILRAPELSDLDMIMEFWNTYETRIFLNNYLPYSRIQEEQWIRNTATCAEKQEEFRFIIEDKNTHKILGSAGVFAINWIDRYAKIGIAIHNPANHNRGY
jgi:RimJ/RimL family protein N-acetyltransferase